MPYAFEWDLGKELQNIAKHGYSFQEAMQVFADPLVIHLDDGAHSSEENRCYAVGRISRGAIRIFGAACWRKWEKFYEQNT